MDESGGREGGGRLGMYQRFAFGFKSFDHNELVKRTLAQRGTLTYAPTLYVNEYTFVAPYRYKDIIHTA